MAINLPKVVGKCWTYRGPTAISLLPISLLYGLLTASRWHLYRWKIFHSKRVAQVVVVVGNVVAGGSGKTPVTISVVEHLLSNGIKVGVVSRGYGRDSRDCREVTDQSSASDVGDEPLLIRLKTAVPVYVGADRYEAAATLARRYPETQVIVSDDGLQHFGLYRNLEICVFDDRGCGNNWLLPAGPLRERWPRKMLAPVGQFATRTITLHTGKNPVFSGFRGTRKLARNGKLSTGEIVPLGNLVGPNAPLLIAVAGTGQPEEFFAMLRAEGLHLNQTIALPDHYDYRDWYQNALSPMNLVCTEKDAVKIWHVAPKAIAVPLCFDAEPAFWNLFDELLGASMT